MPASKKSANRHPAVEASHAVPPNPPLFATFSREGLTVSTDPDLSWVWPALVNYTSSYVPRAKNKLRELTPIYKTGPSDALYRNRCVRALHYVEDCSDRFRCKPSLTYSCDSNSIVEAGKTESLGNDLFALATAIASRV